MCWCRRSLLCRCNYPIMNSEPATADPDAGFALSTVTLTVNDAERVLHNDQEHIVAEVVAARPMQLNGGYVPAGEFAASVPDWEHVPLPIGHPIDTNGNYVSARLPEVIEHAGVGHFQHVNYDDEADELAGEAWVNVEKARKLGEYGELIVEQIEDGDPIEVSTAYRADYGSPGVYDGTFRETVRVNLRPDHVAILPGDLGPGKCSVEDGCGINPDADATDDGPDPTAPADAGAPAVPAANSAPDVPMTPADVANGEAPFPYSAHVIDAAEHDAPTVCLNTAAQLDGGAGTPADDVTDPDPDTDTDVGIARRVLNALGVPASSLLDEQDPESDPDAPTPDEQPSTDGSSGEPDDPDTNTDPDSPSMTDTDLEQLAEQSDFDLNELEQLDDSIVSRLSDALLDAEDADANGADGGCSCGGHNDGESGDAPEADATPGADADDPSADDSTLNDDDGADADPAAARDPRVDDLIETVNAMNDTLTALTEERNAEEQAERADLIEEIQANTDAYGDEQLAEMDTETLRTTRDLVAPKEPEVNDAGPAGAGSPGPSPVVSGTDLSALKPTASVSNSEDDEDLPTPGSLAEYRKQAE